MATKYTAEERKAYGVMMRKKRRTARKAGGSRPVRVSRQVRYTSTRVGMEGCSQSYLLSLLNPYDSYGACIPSSFPLKSQKVHAFIRGEMVVGTGGVGFVLIRPSCVNDVNITTSTTVTSAGTNATVMSAFSNKQAVRMLKLPYASADMTNGDIQARLVSAGLRIRYTGRQDSLNGTISTVESPDHEDLHSLTPIQLGSYEMMEKVRPGPDWTFCNYSGPVKPSDIEFTSNTQPLGTDLYVFCHMVNGTAGDTYEFEYYQNLEYIGRSSVGKTQNHTDPVGYGKIQQVVKTQSAEKPLTPYDALPVANTVVRSIAEAIPGMIETGREIVGVMNLDPGSLLRTALQGLTQQSRGPSLGEIGGRVNHSPFLRLMGY